MILIEQTQYVQIQSTCREKGVIIILHLHITDKYKIEETTIAPESGVGSMVLISSKNNDFILFSNLFVKKEFRRKGYATHFV